MGSLQTAAECAKGLEQVLEQGLKQGIQRLELKEIEIVQGLLAKGCDWVFIQDITRLDQAAYEALRAKHGK